MMHCQRIVAFWFISSLFFSHCASAVDDQKFQELQEYVHALSLSLSSAKTEIADLRREVAAGREERDSMASCLEKVRARAGFFSGFSVRDEGGQSFAPGDRISMPDAITADDYYNPTLSLYTCPVTGLYYFGVELHRPDVAGNSWDIEAALYSSTRVISQLAAYKGTASVRDTVSRSVIAQCMQGESVWVQATSAFSLWGGGRSSFTGFLVHATEEITC